MNPIKYAQMMKYLTRAKKANPDLPNVFSASKAPIPLKRKDVEEIEAINRFMKANPRVEKAFGGMLVQPSADGRRPGYAVSKTDNNKYRVTGERGGVNYSDWARENDVPIRFSNIKEAEAAQKKFYKSVPTKGSITKEAWTNEMTSLTEKFNKMVLNDFEKGDMSKTPKFATWLKNQKLKNAGVKFFETQAPSFGVINVGNKKFELADKLIDEASKTLKYTEWMDIQKKLSPFKDIDTRTWREYIDKNTRINGQAAKVSQAFDYLLDNDVKLKIPKNLSKTMTVEGSLLRKVIADLTGAGKARIIDGLNMNDSYNKNIDQIKFANQGNLWTQGEGRTLSEILENADYRMKGNISWTSDIKLSNRANKNVFDYALRNFNYHQLNKTGEGTIQFYDKKTNKPINWDTLPKNKNGFRVLKPNSVYFIDASMPNQKWDMTSIDADNLKWSKGKGSSGLFDEVFQAKDKYDKLLATKVEDPRNPKKQISFGKLMSEVYQTGFDNFGNPYAIEHTDGVAKNPFKNLKIASQRVNSALSSLNRDTKLSKSQKNKIFKELQKNVFNPADQNMIDNLIKSTQSLQSDVLVKGQTFNQSEIQTLLASFGDGSCAVEFGKGKKDGGRIGYKTGTASLDNCIASGAKNINEGKFKTADQVQDAAKLLSGGKNVLRAITKYGVLPELAFVAGESVFRTALGETPFNSLLKSIDSFTFGATDFGSGIEAEKFGKFSDQKLAVDKLRNSQAKVNSLKKQILNLETLNTGSEFGYEGDQTEAIANANAQLKAAEQELEKNYVNPDIVQFIDKRGQEIADKEMAKSGYAKALLKDQEEGIPTIGFNTGNTITEDGRMFIPQPSQIDLNLNMFPTLPTDIMQLKTSNVIDLAQALRAEGHDVSAKDILAYRDELKQMPLSKQAEIYGDEQIYGTQGAEALQPLAGGGIAKLAGVDSGPPPVSGPNSQGLQGLMKRVRNI